MIVDKNTKGKRGAKIQYNDELHLAWRIASYDRYKKKVAKKNALKILEESKIVDD